MKNFNHTYSILLIFLTFCLISCNSSSDDALVVEVKFENISNTPSFTALNGARVITVLSSIVGVIHEGNNIFSTLGAPDQGKGLADLAENGNPQPLIQSLRLDPKVEIIGIGDEPSAGSRGILGPGQSFKLILSTVKSNSKLSIATSFLQANDIVIMTAPEGIPLFAEDGTPTTGNVTAFFNYYDVGTELNQAPGIGSNQVIRQGEAPAGQISAGPRENGSLRLVDDSFSYPNITQSIRVTISVIESGNVNPSPSASPSISRTPTESPSLSPTVSASVTSTPSKFFSVE